MEIPSNAPTKTLRYLTAVLIAFSILQELQFLVPILYVYKTGFYGISFLVLCAATLPIICIFSLFKIRKLSKKYLYLYTIANTILAAGLWYVSLVAFFPLGAAIVIFIFFILPTILLWTQYKYLV